MGLPATKPIRSTPFLLDYTNGTFIPLYIEVKGIEDRNRRLVRGVEANVTPTPSGRRLKPADGFGR